LDYYPICSNTFSSGASFSVNLKNGFNVEPPLLPPIYASINGNSRFIAAVVAIKPKRKLHENNEICYCLFYSVLGMYVVSHD
jgi:hypothetical protein